MSRVRPRTVGPVFVIVAVTGKVRVEVEKEFNIKVTVENSPEAGSSGTVVVRIIDHNGKVVAEDSATLGIGESADFTFTCKAPKEAGTYTWYAKAYDAERWEVHDSKEIIVDVWDIWSVMFDMMIDVFALMFMMMFFMMFFRMMRSTMVYIGRVV